MSEIFLATIIFLYNDGSNTQTHTSFYTLKDCNRYVEEVQQNAHKGEEVMIMDEKLIWTYKKIEKVMSYCENTNLKTEKQ